MFLRRFVLPALITLAPTFLFAQESPSQPETTQSATDQAAPGEPKTFVDALHQAGVKTTRGPATVALGKVAEYKLTESQDFVGPDSLERFYQLTENAYDGNELGVVIDDSGYMLFFDFADVGYVKDDEKDKLDADKLLASMREGQAAANEQRRKQGWDEMKMQGWASAPHYDQKTHNLTWAINLSSSRDNHQSIWVNENIRLLGRGGYMNVVLVADPDQFAVASQATGNLLAGNFGFKEGQRYAEWKQGDKVAAVGLSALVLGGGAAAAAKMGLLGKLGALIAKLGKGIILIVAGIGAAIMKLIRKITGSHPSDSSS